MEIKKDIVIYFSVCYESDKMETFYDLGEAINFAFEMALEQASFDNLDFTGLQIIGDLNSGFILSHVSTVGDIWPVIKIKKDGD